MKNPYGIWELHYIGSCIESIGTYSTWPQAIFHYAGFLLLVFTHSRACWYLRIMYFSFSTTALLKSCCLLCTYFLSVALIAKKHVALSEHMCCVGLRGLYLWTDVAASDTAFIFFRAVMYRSISEGGINHFVSSMKTSVYPRLSPHFNWVWKDRGRFMEMFCCNVCLWLGCQLAAPLIHTW